MTVRCPQGHDSATTDFCDVCGAPIDATAAVGTASAAPAEAAASPPASSLTLDPPASTRASATTTCPNCTEKNLSDALFCEKCGYDFTTGQLPSAAPPPAPAVPEWVAELWVDPDWFAAQEVSGGCATSGPPTVVPLHGTRALIGRRSRTRNTSPQIDCSADGAVSHTHAELTLANDRWYIEDLGSTNGTFIGAAGEPLPSTPLPPHERHELANDERIYIGAWCRIVVRPATAEETAGATA